MATFKGYFELKTPADLLQKLAYDLARIQAAPLDTYACFDFFITAEHMLDWLYPDDVIALQNKRLSETLLKVCSHLANGAKHFHARNRQHTSVTDTEKHDGPFDDSFDGSFDTCGLVVHLDGDAAKKYGPEIDAEELAELVFAYWQKDLAAKKLL